jgi:hypothetical protein
MPISRPLGDRHQHDVHDTDAADEQRDRCDRTEQDGEHGVRRRARAEERRLVEHLKSAVVTLWVDSSVEVISADAASEAPATSPAP